jgi:hypothetical protein
MKALEVTVCIFFALGLSTLSNRTFVDAPVLDVEFVVFTSCGPVPEFMVITPPQHFSCGDIKFS